jgi:hypothetical protein
MGPIGCPETPVENYHYTLRVIAEERRCHSQIVTEWFCVLKLEPVGRHYVTWVCKRICVRAFHIYCRISVKFGVRGVNTVPLNVLLSWGKIGAAKRIYIYACTLNWFIFGDSRTP